MKTIISVLITLFCFQSKTVAQTDSLSIKGEIGIRGKWQTGNFAQFVINPNGKVTLELKRTRIEIQANYEFLKVNQGSLINDFWTYGLYQYHSAKTIFPIAMVHYGFAQSYAIDRSLIAGLGAGINLVKKKKHSFFQINIFSGYLNLKYKNAFAHQAVAAGSYLRLKFPLKKDLIYVILESHAYLSLQNIDYHSFNSRVVLLLKIVESFGVNVTYSLIYNNNNPSATNEINGSLVFGLNYRFN
ncbi:MAG: DUF481 domain-containing protein [Aureispira sp.]|nr:DUF481 domain-containing protein [Aureispira sp.]